MSKEVKILLPGEFAMGSIAPESGWGRTDCQSLPGTREAGKSTILKRMKWIDSERRNRDEGPEWKHHVFNNIIETFRLIFTLIEELDIEFEDKATNQERQKKQKREQIVQA